jgi:hypothetical protein
MERAMVPAFPELLMIRSLAAAAALAIAAPTAVCAQTPAAASATSQPTAIGAPAAAPTAAAGTPVAVASGTPVKIALTDQLASNTAHTGDHFQFHSLEDVTVDGWIIVPKGALGEGEVVHAESAGGNGHPGKLQLQFDWIYSADNLKVKLSDVPSTNNGDASKGAASTAAIASYLVLGPLGLFAHNFVHGKDVIVKPDQKIQVYVAQSVHVTANQRVSSSDGFAH